MSSNKHSKEKLTIKSVLFFFKDFIYLFIHEQQRERERGRARATERQRHRQREKQASCREPNAGLDPRSPGSSPGLKVGLNH